MCPARAATADLRRAQASIPVPQPSAQHRADHQECQQAQRHREHQQHHQHL